jgi:hypothetical protein
VQHRVVASGPDIIEGLGHGLILIASAESRGHISPRR